MNLAPVIIGAVLGALSAGPAPGAGVLLCDPYSCRSSPYWPPVPVPVRPPVAFLPAPYPPLGPDYPLPPAYPLAPAQPPGLRHSYAAPYAPLGNPPQRPDPPTALAPPPDPPRAPPPPRSPRPPSRQETAQQKDIETSIEAFCDQHPDEQFCGKLGAWLREHPNNRK